jgi:ABC-type branched-subunit amino acid transport system substrate-binding protein
MQGGCLRTTCWLPSCEGNCASKGRLDVKTENRFMQISVLKVILAPAVLAFNLVSTLTARADPGIFDDRIVFGQSAALKGPAAALGLGMRDGISAAFQEANATGGVHGRKLNLVSYNDGYEPEMAIANTRRLIDTDKVFALIGEGGDTDV